MTQRDNGIELGRLLAMLAVVVIHAMVTDAAVTQPWYEAINQLARFAVPFFFIAMGYFARPEAGLARAGRSVVILLLLYFGWYAAYWALFDAGQLPHIAVGTEVAHLWFLRSAALSLAFIVLVAHLAGLGAALIVGLLLYALGVAFGSYSTLVLGQDVVDIWNTRNGITFGAPFIAIGMWLAAHPLRVSVRLGAILFATAALLQLGDVTILATRFGIPPLRHDFVIATLPYGVAAFLFFQSLGETRVARMAAPYGGLALGIYLIHPALMRAMAPWWRPDTPLSFLPYVVVVFALSFAIVFAMTQLPLLRQAVTTSWFRRPKLQPAE